MHLLVLRYGFCCCCCFLPSYTWIYGIDVCRLDLVIFWFSGSFSPLAVCLFSQLVLNVCVRVCRLFVAFSLQFLYGMKKKKVKITKSSSLVHKNVLKPIVRYPVALFSSRYSIVGKKRRTCHALHTHTHRMYGTLIADIIYFS